MNSVCSAYSAVSSQSDLMAPSIVEGEFGDLLFFRGSPFFLVESGKWKVQSGTSLSTVVHFPLFTFDF